MHLVHKATDNLWTPCFFVLDFELAIRLAISEIFFNVNIILCFFHLKQSVHRKTTQLQIIPTDSSLIQEQITLLHESTTRLAFDAQLKISSGIISKISSVFWAYFHNYYLVSGCRFPPEYWAGFISSNHHNRTNNLVESKNRTIKRLIGEGLSFPVFLTKAKEYSLAQVQAVCSELNTSWDSLLQNQAPPSVDPPPPLNLQPILAPPPLGSRIEVFFANPEPLWFRGTVVAEGVLFDDNECLQTDFSEDTWRFSKIQNPRLAGMKK